MGDEFNRLFGKLPEPFNRYEDGTVGFDLDHPQVRAVVDSLVDFFKAGGTVEHAKKMAADCLAGMSLRRKNRGR